MIQTEVETRDRNGAREREREREREIEKKKKRSLSPAESQELRHQPNAYLAAANYERMEPQTDLSLSPGSASKHHAQGRPKPHEIRGEYKEYFRYQLSTFSVPCCFCSLELLWFMKATANHFCPFCSLTKHLMLCPTMSVSFASGCHHCSTSC